MSLPTLLPAVSAFIQRAPRMLVGAAWVEAADGQTMPLHNPATGEVLCVVPKATPEDVDRAVLAARQAFDDSAWSRTRPRERQNLLWKLADLMQRDAEILAQLECLNNGKSAAVAQVMDVQLAIDFLRYMAGWATKIEGSSVEVSLPLMPNDQFHSFIRREAVGVVGAIVAWNFPLLLACWKLGPALATGCTVVLKPADETPLSALKLAELVLEAGYPEGVFNVVTGTGITAGSALTHNPLVDKLTFTGSTAVGKQIGKIAMDSMTRVTLELGGKSPTIVMADADLNSAAAGAASAIFFNQGQVCCAGSRLLVQESVADRLHRKIRERIAKLVIGDSLDKGIDLGALGENTIAIDAADRLRIIGRAGVGVDNVDVKAATRRGVLVVNSPEGNTIAAAEQALALMLSLSRHVPHAHASTMAGGWDRKTYVGNELYKKKLGVVGLGKIGSHVARVAKAMGMDVMAYDPFVSAERAQQMQVRLLLRVQMNHRTGHQTQHR